MYFPQITCFIYIRPQAIFRDEGVDASDWLTVVWVGGWMGGCMDIQHACE